jgi:hypothetical protein
MTTGLGSDVKTGERRGWVIRYGEHPGNPAVYQVCCCSSPNRSVHEGRPYSKPGSGQPGPGSISSISIGPSDTVQDDDCPGL